ncbi:MAG: hypothetical protein US31_C0007G0024 [Berkelbacteria bacterium GW2011_GWA1_36_9]|uniref:Uncharacterized protein n=1 Tax=Berkelbacteria bacterium GW2011_GWA1_36_9 TaxID=1618331 RepID=A0A0G0FGL5_9BACT|nr:MAG: hypothetical protein US31_C0007G0024 [Berkelbacteria bacterium GW2011_GWA1_36_9]
MKNRESIKNELEVLIKKYHFEKQLSVEMVIKWVAEEDESDVRKANRDYQNKWLKYFNNVPDIDEFNNILQCFTDAWNYFPHKSLNDLSPMEMINKSKS